jgi:hypothetical protein
MTDSISSDYTTGRPSPEYPGAPGYTGALPFGVTDPYSGASTFSSGGTYPRYPVSSNSYPVSSNVTEQPPFGRGPTPTRTVTSNVNVRIGAGIQPLGARASDEWRYTSKNPEVAYVSADGIISGVTVGVTNVTATKYGDSNTYVVTVRP